MFATLCPKRRLVRCFYSIGKKVLTGLHVQRYEKMRTGQILSAFFSPLTRLSSLGPWSGPAGRANPNKLGPGGRGFGRQWSRPRPDASVLVGQAGSALPDRRSLPALFHAGGVTPSRTLRRGKAFTDVNPSESDAGGGNSACK